MAAANYTNLLLSAREAADARLQKKGLGGNSLQSVDDDTGPGKALVRRRYNESVDEEGEYDFGMEYFSKLRAHNVSLKKAYLESYSAEVDVDEGSSTGAMTDSKGNPVDILNQGDDVTSGSVDEEDFMSALIMSESSNNSTAEKVKADGSRYVGELQFGDPRLDDAKKALGLSFTIDEFKQDPKLQKKIAAWHIKDIDRVIDTLGSSAKGYDRNGLRAVAHLGGNTGMKKFVMTKGKYNPHDGTDENPGTYLSEYYSKFSNTGGTK